MEKKRRLIILVAIALILAVTAITLSSTDSDIPTIGQDGSPTGAVIGIAIEAVQVEDKLIEEGLSP